MINNQTLYKVKSNEDSSFELKAYIAAHGNEDVLRGQLLSDGVTCSTVVLRLVEFIVLLKGWTMHKADFKSASYTDRACTALGLCQSAKRENDMKSTYFGCFLQPHTD